MRQLFWLALLGTIRAATGGVAPPPPTPGFDGHAMVEKVRSELATAGRFIVIIDDLHELRSAEAIEQLANLLTELPPDVHAVVATRRDLPLRLHRLRLAGDLAEIRAGQLRFTRTETRKLLTAAGIKLRDPVVAALHERTEGWAAGLRLAVLSLAGHPDPEQFVAEFSGSDRTVAQYLMAEMLDRQPPEMQRLLLRTSLLDRLNGELADLLTGATGSERILLDLEDANAFVVSLDPARTWFRYHHMFRGMLRLELRRSVPGDVPALHRIAARWFADHADTAEAIRHLQAAGDWTEAAELLADHALSLTLDGQAGTVAALLHSFPARAAVDFPGWRWCTRSPISTSFSSTRPMRTLTWPGRTPRRRHPTAQHRLRMAIASADLSATLRGHFDGVLAQIDAMFSPAVGQSNAEVALGSDLRALALLNLGVTEAWSLRLADSERHLLEGAALAREIGRPYLEVACLAHLGFAATGNSLEEARRRCEDAIALAVHHGWDTEAVIAPALATLAGILIGTGEFELGEQWLDRARRATPAAGEPGVQLLVHLISAILPAARGHYDEALVEFAAAEQVQALMVGEHALTSRVTAWTIATHARRGDFDQAVAALAAIDDRLAATGEIRNAAAAVRLADRDPAGARRELAAVLDGSASVNPDFTLVEAHLMDALACTDLGDKRAARAAVATALRLAEPDRLVLPFAMTGAWELLAALPPQETSHAALVADILDTVHGNISGHITASEPADELSPSELRVLRYLPTNLTRPEIAGKLSVSPNTVNTHIRRIYAKLGATDRSTAVQRGRELRLLSSGRA